MIIVKYEQHPVKKVHLRNQWKAKCTRAELKSSQIWQEREVNMRSNITKIITLCPTEQESNEESCHVTRRALKNMEDGEQEVLIDNTLSILRESCMQKKVGNFSMISHWKRLIET